MRILMLGNSFTYYHRMPEILSEILKCEVVSHTRGGAQLSEQLNENTEMGARTLKALREEKWDYVVLQEQSILPAKSTDCFLKSAAGLCRIIRENGAMPVFYATWAYREGSKILAKTPYTFQEMDEKLLNAYKQAAEKNNALMAPVGQAFSSLRSFISLYEKEDDYHPSEAGSAIAAGVIAKTILTDLLNKSGS
ncbi:MAG: SGNH/GDSL hydrolase family protein [Clostridia bacterium]|nr:SGNH/GDSL hydrolase family protein [Clostridia bacterium]